MSFKMQPARFPNGGFPEALDRTPGSDQTYPAGTVVTFDTGSQEVDGKATDPTTAILGVSLEGVSAGVADNPSGLVGVVTAGRSNTFMARLTNGSGTIQTVDEANIGVTYALLKNGTGRAQWWSVNEADSTGGVAQVIAIDTELNVVYFKFTEASIQEV